MIFVTTGTTMPFDELLMEIDRLAISGRFEQQFICQTGASDFVPGNCESFRFRHGIDDLLTSADVVVTHGGSTVLKLLQLGRPFVAVPNPRGADDHQGELLETLGSEVGVLWTRDVNEIEPLIERALNGYRVSFEAPSFIPDLVDYIGS